MIILGAIRRVAYGVVFLSWFLWEIIVGSLQVARAVIGLSAVRPAIIAVPLSCRTSFEVLLFANVVSLTPGTVSMDVAPDRSVLFVHTMFLTDLKSLRNLEDRLLRVLR